VTPPSPRALPRLSGLIPGIYYGWFVIGGTTLLAFAGVGIGFYSLTVFQDALCDAHGWPRASVSGASSLYFALAGVVGWGIGGFVDRRGARGFIGTGACILAVGLLAVGRVEAPWQLYPVYALMAIGYALCGTVPQGALIARWFVGRRALAMSISQTGVSLGGIIVVPLASWLILEQGIDMAMGWLAGGLLVVALPVTLFVLRSDPLPHGLEPDGSAVWRARNPLLSDERQRRSWTRRQALRTRTFWLLGLAFAVIMFCQLAVLIHELALLRERMSLAAAALAFGVTPAGSIVGRLLLGLVADRIDKRLASMALFAVQALTLVGFALVPGTAGLIVVAFLFGTTIGNVFMMHSLLVAELYGMEAFGSVYGTLQLITQVAGGLGPVALGLAFDALGTYTQGLLALAALATVACLVLGFLKPPRLEVAAGA
jgi:sugar phosphate permease